MTTIGKTPGLAPLNIYDRAAVIKSSAEASDGRFSEADVAKRMEESDRMHLRMAQNEETFLRGDYILVGGNPDMQSQVLEQARQARAKPYAHMSGPITISALDVGAAVKAQNSMTGQDLKDLSTYGAYLKNEISAASSVKSDVTFTGSWGKDRITHDVNEYIGWLMQAARLKSKI
jgi:hypothetical protein